MTEFNVEAMTNPNGLTLEKWLEAAGRPGNTTAVLRTSWMQGDNPNVWQRNTELNPLREMQILVEWMSGAILKDPIYLAFCNHDTEEGELNALVFVGSYWIYQGKMEVKTIAGPREVDCWVVEACTGYSLGSSGESPDFPDVVEVARVRHIGDAATAFLREVFERRAQEALDYDWANKEAEEYTHAR